jgi:hypothetical protein
MKVGILKLYKSVLGIQGDEPKREQCLRRLSWPEIVNKRKKLPNTREGENSWLFSVFQFSTTTRENLLALSTGKRKKNFLTGNKKAISPTGN